MNHIVDSENSVSVPKLTFDTRSFRARDRVDAWWSNMGVFFDMSNPDGSKLGDGVQASIEACNLAGTVFGVTTSQGQRFERSDLRVTADGMDHFLVQVFLEGGGITRDGEKFSAGDMLVIDLEQPHDMLNSDFSNLTWVLPRSLSPALAETLYKLHNKPLSQTMPLVRLLSAHLCSLWSSVDKMTVQDSLMALKGTIGLMELWLSNSGNAIEVDEPAVSAALGKSICHYIDRHLDQPLTPDELTTVFNISKSQLYRIFRPFNGVTRYVFEQRLVKSMKILGNPVFDHFNISAIAYKCGFSTESHFSRSFKERFGTTPGNFRRESRRTAFERMHAERANDDVKSLFANWVRDMSPDTAHIATGRK